MDSVYDAPALVARCHSFFITPGFIRYVGYSPGHDAAGSNGLRLTLSSMSDISVHVR
jgi:hypothetical protein